MRAQNHTMNQNTITNHLQYKSFIKSSKNPIKCHFSKACTCKFGLKEKKPVLSLLTTSVFKAVDGVWEKPDTAQETSSLLFMNFLVIPHADRYWIRLPNVSEKCGTNSTVSGTHWAPWWCIRNHLGGRKISNHLIKNLTHSVMAGESKSSAGRCTLCFNGSMSHGGAHVNTNCSESLAWEGGTPVNWDLFQQQHSRLWAGSPPQLSEQPQACSAPCPSPACPKGTMLWHPCSVWGQQEQGQQPQCRAGARSSLGLLLWAPGMQCREPSRHCQAKASPSCSCPSPGRLTDPQWGMAGTLLTPQSPQPGHRGSGDVPRSPPARDSPRSIPTEINLICVPCLGILHTAAASLLLFWLKLCSSEAIALWACFCFQNFQRTVSKHSR